MDANFEKFLRATIEARRRLMPPTDLKYVCTEDLVLAVGYEYKHRPRPKSFSAGTPKRCFGNSAELALADPKLIYVEGFGVIRGVGIPTAHAWVVRRGTNVVIDVTTDNIEYYHGIPFRTDFLRSAWDLHPRGIALIDNWEDDYPLLKMGDEQLREIMEEGPKK